MEQVIILSVENELRVFSSQESIRDWLSGNEDEEIGRYIVIYSR